MDKVKFRQCKLSRGNTQLVTWLEEKPGLAIGALVEVQTDSHAYERWVVLSVGATDRGYIDVVSEGCEQPFWGFNETPPEYIISGSKPWQEP
jgi:hypothetical protein